METALDTVRQLAAQYSGRKIEAIGPDTRVFHDLGLDGDDAEEFLTDYCARHGLPVQSFPFSRFFGWEIGAGPRHFLCVKLGLWPGVVKPLSIRQLASCAEARTFLDL